MPHPIKALKAAYLAALQTLADLSGALRAQSAATTELQNRLSTLDGRLAAIEAAAKSTEKSTAYLSASERHRREQSGQRHEF